jgi:hypothetical protein
MAIEKSKSWGLFWSYQLNSTTNLVNRLNWQCCLAGSSITTPRILIFFNGHGCRLFI